MPCNGLDSLTVRCITEICNVSSNLKSFNRDVNVEELERRSLPNFLATNALVTTPDRFVSAKTAVLGIESLVCQVLFSRFESRCLLPLTFFNRLNSIRPLR